ncbi:MAG: FAD-dependent thymidylate synthase [Candidatus Micrarchaeaceae archaeon]
MPGLTKFVERYTDDEKAVLSTFFSNVNSNVFALQNMPEVTKAALVARYSRSELSMRKLFLKEFVTNPETGHYYDDIYEAISAINKANSFSIGGKRANTFFNRVFAEYGDDSVIDSAGAHVAIEGIDQLEAKYIEDGRLAGYIEKSTRYVDFTATYRIDDEGYVLEKGDGNRYLYKEYEPIMQSSLAGEYTNTMDMLFKSVKSLQSMLEAYLMKKMPIEGESFSVKLNGKQQTVKFSDIVAGVCDNAEKEEKRARSAYKSSIKAKSLDLARGLLPASTITNLGWYASFRSFDHSLKKMLSYDYPPINQTATQVYEELKKGNEHLISGVKSQHGLEEIEFMRAQRQALERLGQEADRIYASKANGSALEGIGLKKPALRRKIDNDKNVEFVSFDGDEKSLYTIAAMSIYPYSKLPLKGLISLLRSDKAKSSPINAEAIIAASVKGRENRRYKPPRSFEAANYIEEWRGNFGIFRDLQRNRFALQVRKELGIDEGYTIPAEIYKINAEGFYKDKLEAAASLYKDMKEKLPQFAQVVVPFAYRLKWYAAFDLRQAIWMHELRTSRQGHPDYRKLMQESFYELSYANPSLVNKGTMKFIDLNSYGLERLGAEKNKEDKLSKI